MLIIPVDQQFVKICDHLAPHSKFTRPLGEDVLDSGSLVLPCSYRSSDGTESMISCAHVDSQEILCDSCYTFIWANFEKQERVHGPSFQQQ